MMAAGLVAKKAVERGLEVKPWVKTSLAPGSKVVTDYLMHSGLQGYLDQLGFQLVGYGCTTCIGNSGPLDAKIAHTVDDNQLTVCSVLSGNRNFEGRIHAQVKANWLASPPLVVAFALAGTTLIDFCQEPIGVNHCGEDIYLRDIWPTNDEIEQNLAFVRQQFFRERYASVFKGDHKWQSLPDITGNRYPWDPESSYIKKVPFFDEANGEKAITSDIRGARILSLFGDTITTDHISPAGEINANGAAGQYLREQGISPAGFNSFGARRGNHEVMVRGTFSNSRLINKMLDGKAGGFTIHAPSLARMNIYEAAMHYHAEQTPLVIFAGKEYGTGSSRDWAAKGTRLLGVKAVIAESFERIHRTNLIGMGVLPIELTEEAFHDLCLKGDEVVSIVGISQLDVNSPLTLVVDKPESGEKTTVEATARVDTDMELKYLYAGGILNYVLNQSVDHKAGSAYSAVASP